MPEVSMLNLKEMAAVRFQETGITRKAWQDAFSSGLDSFPKKGAASVLRPPHVLICCEGGCWQKRIEIPKTGSGFE